MQVAFNLFNHIAQRSFLVEYIIPKPKAHRLDGCKFLSNNFEFMNKLYEKKEISSRRVGRRRRRIWRQS